MFQSTRPRGARRRPRLVCGWKDWFQSTRPRGARLNHQSEPCGNRKFQSTRPRGARPKVFLASIIVSSFNPRARGGRDLDESIPCIYNCFNPRARGGRDPHCHRDVAAQLFQSTRPRGARLIAVGRMVGSRGFQSTRPRGARPLARASDFVFFSFNPRARGGRDTLEFVPVAHKRVSIHAPAGGATCQPRSLHCRGTFQSTRPRGARLFFFGHVMIRIVSIHAPAGGATVISH